MSGFASGTNLLKGASVVALSVLDFDEPGKSIWVNHQAVASN
jgi:hypothetical protein